MDHRQLRERLAFHRGEQPDGLLACVAPESDPDEWRDRVERLRHLVAARRQCLAPLRTTDSADAESLAKPPDLQIGIEVQAGVRLLQADYPDTDLRSLPTPPLTLPGPVTDADRQGPLVIFDTETTGLGSGAGQWVWMVGMLIYQQQRWRLSQWWLSKPGSECLFLESIAQALPADGQLLSYNGRSFDVPMLRNRHALHGMPNPFADRPHLDLLHLVRRRYRGRWSDCRLATVERELLQRPRSNDLPGSMAPQAWRDYLRSGKAQGVAQVLRHNRDDLESLVYLLEALEGQGYA